jgi:hypothetical protein
VISKSRNIIQNGNFDVWQRGTSFAAIANGSYVADRWKYAFVSSTGVATVSQDTTTPDTCSLYDIKVACTTADGTVAAGEYVYLQQGIEGTFFQAVRPKPMVLSFWVKAYQTGTFCVAICSSGADETFIAEYTIGASATWEKKIIQIPPIPAGTWATGTSVAGYLRFVLQSGSTLGDGTAGWQAANKLSTSNQTNAYSSTDNYWQVSQVQLEAGSSATEFEVLDPDQVLSSCHRYLVAYGGNAAYERVATGIILTSSIATVTPNLPVAMRAAPAVTYDAVGSWTVFYGNNAISECTAISMTNASSKVATMNCTATGTPLTPGEGATLGADNTTAARLYLSAEI